MDKETIEQPKQNEEKVTEEQKEYVPTKDAGDLDFKHIDTIWPI